MKARPAARPRARAIGAAVAAAALLIGSASALTVTAPAEPAHAATTASTPYGYMMVHFIEDSAGYAEKIYIDVTHGDDPTHWDTLNGGKPILASNLGTAGVRDPYLTYNPNTGIYYLIATDLRVYGGDNAGWGEWSRNGSRYLDVWQSTDLINWGTVRQVLAGPATLGMAWAPEATWVPSLGKFVVYWTSDIYPTTARTGSSYNRVVWGTTTDFATDFTYGGTMIDDGVDTLDTTVIQDGGTTYRVTKDNSASSTRRLYMQSTTATDWWKQTTSWTTVQQNIGYADYGYVEGPAMFKDHNSAHWYLYVDDSPTPGYRPYETTNLAAGWTKVDPATFSLTANTKHGGVLSLTKGQYDAVRAADLTAVTSQNFSVNTLVGTAPVLPTTATTTQRGGTASTAPITWNAVPSSAYAKAGTFTVDGVVKSIGNNLNESIGGVLSSSTAIDNVVTATVVVRPTIATGSHSLQSVNYPDRSLRHRDYLGYVDQVNSSSTAQTKQDATFTVVKGLADSSCYSFVTATGLYLRHSAYRLRADARSGATFDADATFCTRPGSTSSSVAFESYNYPGRYLRHRNFEVWLDTTDGTSGFAADSSFVVTTPWS